MRFLLFASSLLLASCMSTHHFNDFAAGAEVSETKVFVQSAFTKETAASPARFVAPALEPVEGAMVFSTTDFTVRFVGGGMSQTFNPKPNLVAVWNGSAAMGTELHSLRVEMVAEGFRLAHKWASLGRPHLRSVKVTLDGKELPDIAPQKEPLLYPFEFLRWGQEGFVRRDDINTFPWVNPEDPNAGHESYQLVRYGALGFSYHVDGVMTAQYNGRTVRFTGQMTPEKAAVMGTGIAVNQLLGLLLE